GAERGSAISSGPSSEKLRACALWACRRLQELPAMSPNPPKGVLSTPNRRAAILGGRKLGFCDFAVPHQDPSLFTPAIHVDALDIEALPIGATTRLLVDLV